MNDNGQHDDRPAPHHLADRARNGTSKQIEKRSKEHGGRHLGKETPILKSAHPRRGGQSALSARRTSATCACVGWAPSASSAAIAASTAAIRDCLAKSSSALRMTLLRVRRSRSAIASTSRASPGRSEKQQWLPPCHPLHACLTTSCNASHPAATHCVRGGDLRKSSAYFDHGKQASQGHAQPKPKLAPEVGDRGWRGERRPPKEPQRQKETTRNEGGKERPSPNKSTPVKLPGVHSLRTRQNVRRTLVHFW
jgi:hypothetical protein